MRLPLAIVLLSGLAHAETTMRVDRRIQLAVVVPDALYIHDRDDTIPLPSARLGIAVTPRVHLDLGVGYVPAPYDSHFAMVTVGARWLMRHARAFSPYVMARVGAYDTDPDEGRAERYEFATVGGGLEYAGDHGFGVWLEIGPAVVSHPAGTKPGAYGSAGLGYRFPVSW